MDIKELHSFKMSDAVKFHDKLNPNLWRNNHLDPAVRKQLIVIAEDFLSNMGISGLDVKDITVSGSSAAYSYTPHSDLDLHILVDMSKLPNDEVYRELFTAKKTLYNDSHNIKVKGVPVELYVQDSNQPVVSLGEYSILDDKWLKIPSKRRANLDQNATKAKYDKLAGLVDLALKSRNLERVKDTIKTIKRYRQAGLDTYGEFGPENLAYKAVRSQGAIDALYKLRDELHGEELSIEEMYSGPKMKFLRPGELKGSYTDYDLLRMGFKKSQNGSWYIPQVKWDKLVAAQQIGEEEELAERYAKEFEGYAGNNPAIGKVKTLTARDIKGKYTDDQLIAVGFKKEPNGNFTIPLLKWNKLRSTNKLEDYDPNGVPPGPEFKPTMPAGTVKVDVSDTYDWYKLGQHISNLKGLGKHDFGKGPPSTILSFGDEDIEHKYIQDLEKTGLTTTDIDPIDPNQPKGMKRQKVDPTYNVNEAFDQPYKLKWEKGDHGDVDAIAKLDDGNYLSIMFNKGFSQDTKEEAWSVEFFRNNSQEVTLEGDAYRVFATVLSAIQTFIKKYKPNKVFFAASKETDEYPYEPGEPRPNPESRAKLYDRMVQRYAKSWEYSALRTDTGSKVIYELSRINKNVKEDETMQYAASKTPPTNPYGGMEDMQYRGGISEASGYIPSEKEKNDPRWSMALTKDVRPNAVKKNAKAFSWLTSRAGIPPQARTDGKV